MIKRLYIRKALGCHSMHILAIITEFWSHQTHPSSFNMKSPRLGGANTEGARVSAIRCPTGFLLLPTRVLPRPQTSLLDHCFHYLHDGASNTAPTGSRDAMSWWEKTKSANGIWSMRPPDSHYFSCHWCSWVIGPKGEGPVWGLRQERERNERNQRACLRRE